MQGPGFKEKEKPGENSSDKVGGQVSPSVS